MNRIRLILRFAWNAPRDLLTNLRHPPEHLRGWALVRASLLDSWAAEGLFEQWRTEDAEKARRGLMSWEDGE